MELERAVDELGALGVQVFTNCNGRAMDDPRFEPLWARLEALECAVWVHGARQPSIAGLSSDEERSRYGLWAALGWPYEMGMFAARMVASGVLDRYPRLPFYLHHSGGMLPTFIRRVNGSWLELQQQAPEDEAGLRTPATPARRVLPALLRRHFRSESGRDPRRARLPRAGARAAGQ